MYILEQNQSYSYGFEDNYDYYSGSGIDYLNITNSINDDDDDYVEYNIGVYIALSPLLFAACIISLIILFNCIILPINECLEGLKIKFHNLLETRKLPIKNNYLTKAYIKELNNNNIEKAKKIDNNSCSICLADIDIDNRNNLKKFVFLDCGHTHCRKCIQKWVKTKVTSGSTPDCPTCRIQIVDIPQKVVENDYDSDYSYNLDYD